MSKQAADLFVCMCRNQIFSKRIMSPSVFLILIVDYIEIVKYEYFSKSIVIKHVGNKDEACLCFVLSLLHGSLFVNTAMSKVQD